MPVISSEPRFWAVSSTGLGMSYSVLAGIVGGLACAISFWLGPVTASEMSSELPRLTISGAGVSVSSGCFSGGRIFGASLLLLGALLQLDVHHLGFELVLELVAGPLELGHVFAELPGEAGEPLGANDHQGQEKDEDHLWHAEIHGSMINQWIGIVDSALGSG